MVKSLSGLHFTFGDVVHDRETGKSSVEATMHLSEDYVGELSRRFARVVESKIAAVLLDFWARGRVSVSHARRSRWTSTT